MLRQAGFAEATGKGSHLHFWHPTINGTYVTLSGNDGSDAGRFHEKQVAAAITRVSQALKDGSKK